jgi:hypothetical protein
MKPIKELILFRISRWFLTQFLAILIDPTDGGKLIRLSQNDDDRLIEMLI